ncbi:MAG: TolC family protein [Firmicutes bacterium]|jgi:hypothetical protein|nr:TolC family protein [Bacillota bacterium]NLL87885.1 TolC family protein [Bacillota bacterium]HKM17814.1 TolC family protein [Limnochordia bacterium]
MATKLLPWLLVVIIPGGALGFWTIEACATSITLLEAVDLAFERNAQYRLSLWEHELALEEQRLKEQELTIHFSSTPLNVRNGKIQPDNATMVLAMSLGDHTTLTTTLSGESEGLDLDFGGDLDIQFKYDLFTPPKQAGPQPEANSMLAMENELVLQVATTFTNLIKELNRAAYEELRLAYLKEAHEAAVVTDNSMQTSSLKQQLYESEKRLANYQMTARQHNQQLNNLLNTDVYVDFKPVISNKAYRLEYGQDQLIDLALAASSRRNQAEAAVKDAETQLEAAKRAFGWNINTTAKLQWDFDWSHSPSWSIGLTASKTLYPPSLQAEKDALRLAQAQLQLAEVEYNIRSQVSQLLDKLAISESQYRDLEENLITEEAELETKRRLYGVGLTTELKLQEHQVELARLQMELSNNRYDHFLSLLQLFDLCGFELAVVIQELVE